MRTMLSLLRHLDGLRPAFLRADAAALAVVETDDRPPRGIDRDRDVRAELPADVALRARLEPDHGPERPPARRLDHVARDRGNGPLREVLLRHIRGRLVRVVSMGTHATTASSIRTPRDASLAASAFASILAGTKRMMASTPGAMGAAPPRPA